MPRLPVVSGREAIRALGRAGFLLDGVEGSHHIMIGPAGRIAVPVHGSRDLKPGTLRGIIRDAGLTVDQFCDFLK